MRLAKIAVEAATYAIDKPYTYLVPEDMPLSVGCRVLGPFGRGNRVSEGMVLELTEDLPSGPVKAVHLNVDGDPIAGNGVYNGIPMEDDRDISWHKTFQPMK